MIPLMIVVGGFLLLAGTSQNVAFLSALSAVVIASTGYQYGEGVNEPRYWLTLAGFSTLHCGALYAAGGDWMPSLTIAVMPIFILDFVLMAYSFPAVSGLEYEY
ncbi:hypothetical protein [Sphingomonas sp. SAFR-052]|uniref:hypothetical protein n=1 Tax=Sphingomonas sp. SAFR-052 TaxID=3436867 RepID=UPI003F806D58